MDFGGLKVLVDEISEAWCVISLNEILKIFLVVSGWR